ncbi:hypothetical protein IAR55_006478 [Kwoniella newhampshirensis]|uniref:Nuclear pore complex protein Nup205 n=1 Tax=Kwoniella newhampshirensis TaxID=1651941 RepID=A0AAW0YTC6_9TREE
MSVPHLVDWDASLFNDLQHLLGRIVTQPTTSTLRKLFAKLDEARPWLLNLAQLPQPNDVDKRYIEKMVALQAEEQRFQYPAQSPLEIAVYVLYKWTNDLLDFLRELLRITLTADAEVGGPFESLKDWVEELLSTRSSLGEEKGEGSMVDQIIVQLDTIQGKVDELLRSGPAGGSYDLLRFRVEALRAEQNKMTSVLALIAEGGHLGRGQVIRIIKWLRKCDRTDGLVAVVAEDWCHDIKFLKIASSLIEQWMDPRLRETVKLAWCLFYLSCFRHDSSVVQSGIDAHQMEHFIFEAVESFQFLHSLVFDIRRERGLEEQVDVNLDALVKIAVGSDASNDGFLFRQIQDLIDLLAGRKQFLRNLKNREEDAASRRSQTTANYQAFVALVAVVYKSLPADSAGQLWDNTTFLGTVLDTRGVFPAPAFWDMLTAISAGPVCAAKSYEKMKDTRLSWNALFKFYQHYIDIMPHIYEPIKTSRSPSLDPMPHEEVTLCKGWTSLLTTVVRWSPAARGALLQAKPHPVQILFEFLNCENLPLDLKATILNAITAFCQRTGDPIDDDVVSRAVDYYERITFRDPALDTRHLDSSRIPPPVGWLAKMEYLEQDTSSYSSSRAYVAFLTSLLSMSRTPPRLINALRRGTYYILDSLLMSLMVRRYARDSERWELIDTVTAFLEKALLGFSMDGLEANSGHVASELAEEPGFIVLLRILSDSNVFAVLASVLDNAASTSSPRPAIVTTVLLRILRIYHRVLDIQLVFAEVLLLILEDPTRNPNHPFKRPYGLQSIDNHLLAHLSNINVIALLVGEDNPAMAFVSLKIISALARSQVFSRSDVFRGEYTSSVNRLAGIIDASDDSIRIAQGFCRRLGDTAEEDISSLILDLLVEGTSADVTSPNLAHVLLGYDFQHRDVVLHEGESCFHVVLRQLCEGTELNGASGDTLVSIHPTYAAKSAQLVYQLFSHPLTGRSTLSYAMSVYGYSARQLASLPRDSEIPTIPEDLVAFLDFQRWIVSSAALEIFTYEGHGASADHVTSTLFRGLAEAEDELEHDERPPLIIDLLSSVDVQLIESPPSETRSLEFHNGFDFDQYKRLDANWFDLDAVAAGLKAWRRGDGQQGGSAAEAEYIMERLASTNRETDISIAKGNFLTSWNALLKVALVMLFRNVAEEQQEVLLFDLLEALLTRLEVDVPPGILDLICDSILVTITTLVNALAELEGVNLPIDRLALTLAKIIDATVRPGSTETARGNLYASIGQYNQLIGASANAISDDRSVMSNDPAAPTASLLRSTLNVLAAKKERLMPILCRDAMDDREVWKTQCFALLAGIVSLCHQDRDRHILSPLTANGYLPLFVRSIKERELAMQECLSPEPDEGAAISTRQHRILVCSLQLLTRTLSSLHKSSRSGAGHVRGLRWVGLTMQALSFLNAHRDAIMGVLGDSGVTNIGVEECRLVVSILCMVVHKVPASDLHSPSGFGAFHSAILSLAARFFDRDSWIEGVEDVSKVILAYLCASTAGLKADSGIPVFVTGAQRHGGLAYIASAPSMQTAVNLLSDLVETVQDVSDNYDVILDRIQDDDLEAEEIQKLRDSLIGDESLSEDAIKSAFVIRTQVLFNMIESLLLLVWRHLLFYHNESRRGLEPIRPTNLSLSLNSFSSSQAQLVASRSGAGTLKILEKVSAALKGTLVRLDDMEVNLELRRLATKSDAYYSMLVRRLKEFTSGVSESSMEED